VCENGSLVRLEDSALAGAIATRPSAAPELGIEAEWEIDATDIQIIHKIGEGEFGEVSARRACTSDQHQQHACRLQPSSAHAGARSSVRST
jgi:hypothetical protein